MRLKIGCTTYPVVHTAKPFFADDEQQLNGHIDYQQPEIRIWTKGPDPKEVLLHEALHGVITDRALDALVGPDEEMLVTSLSRGLMAVIRDNPSFLKALGGK